MSPSANRAERAAGVLLAAAAGDALGWPQEMRGGLIGGQRARDLLNPQPRYRAWTRHGGSRFSGLYHDPVGAGEYSDDTQLLCATARACLAGDGWFRRFVEIELPTWPTYQRGGGRAVLAAAASWSEGRPPWAQGTSARAGDRTVRYFRAGANGVAMRIAPHVLYARHAKDQLFERVVLDGIATHGHPRALVGALVYAAALATAFHSDGTLEYGALVSGARDGLVGVKEVLPLVPDDWADANHLAHFEEAWSQTNYEASNLIDVVEASLNQGAMSNVETTLRSLGCMDPAVNGAGTVTAASALYLASRSAARPLTGLIAGAFLQKADTDTLASMTGALLGAIHGADWLGELIDVQDAEYLGSLASQLETPPDVARLSVPTARPIDLRKRVHQDLSNIRRAGAAGEFPDGRKYRLIDISPLEGGKTPVVRARIVLEDGQSALIDQRSTDSQQPVKRMPKQVATSIGGATVSTSEAHPQHGDSSMRPDGYISLATNKIAQCANFYGRLLGRDIRVTDGQANITDWLILRQVERTVELRSQEHRIFLLATDLIAAAHAVDVEILEDGANMYLRARDPDGRYVRVEHRR